jgi:hypothetical protein
VTVRQLVLTTIGTALLIACVLIGVQQAGFAQEPTTATADPTPSVASLVLSLQPTPDAHSTSQAQSQSQPVLASAPVATLLKRYLMAEADSADRSSDWSGHIRSVTVALQTATVHTDLDDSPDDQRLAQEIADVAARFVVGAAGQPASPPDIVVLAANDEELARHMTTRMARRAWEW